MVDGRMRLASVSTFGLGVEGRAWVPQLLVNTGKVGVQVHWEIGGAGGKWSVTDSGTLALALCNTIISLIY